MGAVRPASRCVIAALRHIFVCGLLITAKSQRSWPPARTENFALRREFGGNRNAEGSEPTRRAGRQVRHCLLQITRREIKRVRGALETRSVPSRINNLYAKMHGFTQRSKARAGSQRITGAIHLPRAPRLYIYNTALAASPSRSLNLVQVDGDRWSPLPRAAKLGELVLARVALGQRAKVVASAACCFPARIVRAWPCLVERGRFAVPAHTPYIA